MTFPNKGLSKRKQQEWLNANNPYPAGHYKHHLFAADFYSSQAKAFSAQSNVALKVSLAFFSIAIAAQIVGLILRLAA